jgi:hypothetical protein
MILELLLTCAAIAADGSEAGDDPPAKAEPVVTVKAPEPGGVEWTELGISSFRFLTIMHGFQLATEPGTRAGGFGLGTGYAQSVGNLHGWADGDPFYVNYVGHPMQGAVSGRLWLLHGRRYRRTEFGSSADYWKGRQRAIAFAWAFSEQFEIGPVSEASVGHIQKDSPQMGFVDHVVTPAMGLTWMVAEDVVDKSLIKPIRGAHSQHNGAYPGEELPQSRAIVRESGGLEAAVAARVPRRRPGIHAGARRKAYRHGGIGRRRTREGGRAVRVHSHRGRSTAW